MRRISRTALLTIAVIIVFAAIWSRTRFVFFVNLSLFQALFLFGGAAFVLFLVMDHFINRD